ncbi:MAG: tyrosine-type recombinase/integrase [Planctomycetaceae bacterium]|nr:tyrosine-type recombinase/integrase [Planctomycetaceae bacterium]
MTAITILPPISMVPSCVEQAGPHARAAFDEFFEAQIRNSHTRAAYLQAVRAFSKWLANQSLTLPEVEPGIVGMYFNQHGGSIPTRKLHLAALRAFFDLLVTRHVLVQNPAHSVRGERYSVVEGKTPEISKEQARALLASIEPLRPVDVRDQALIQTLIYTTARAGAVSRLRLRDFVWDGTQYSLRFAEKGGKSRSIPVRHDLQRSLLAYLNLFDWQSQPKDAPLFRSIMGRSGQLTETPLRNIDVTRMVRRRLQAAGLPMQFSAHSFRVATITDLLTQGVPLEDVQHLAGHADPRTTRLYDRRQKQVTRNMVERISI